MFRPGFKIVVVGVWGGARLFKGEKIFGESSMYVHNEGSGEVNGEKVFWQNREE